MDGKRQISFRLLADQAEALARVAEENDRTVSGEIRWLIRRHVRPRSPDQGLRGFYIQQSRHRQS